MADLKVTVEQAAPAEFETPLLVLPHFEREDAPEGDAAAVDEALGGRISRVLERGDFKGTEGETLLLYPDEGASGPERVLLVGAGDREAFTAERLRRAVGSAVREAERLDIGALAVGPRAAASAEDLDAETAARAAAEGAVLAAWSYRDLKTGAEPEPPSEVEAAVLLAGSDADREAYERGARHGNATASAENLSRLLAMRPGNVATPSHLAETARTIAEEHGLELTVLGREELEREGMNALLAVAQGSEEPPRFIVLEYRGADPDERPVALVGKGVTFDAGGISIKPSKKMEQMKYDMSGAAAVLGATQAVAALGLPINLVALAPATENLPSGTALKPGDVIHSHRGKTIEIINTDAEGRLILADALAYADRFEPRAILDAATLTGSCVVALGHHAVGVMGNDEAVVDEVRGAGDETGERAWPLPLWDDYRPQLDSDVADLKNTGGRPAGTITAGWFLREFVGDGVPWAHLDIAGTAWKDDALPYLRKGATGVPTRLFVEWVRARSEA